jgi:hypothetical protein
MALRSFSACSWAAGYFGGFLVGEFVQGILCSFHGFLLRLRWVCLPSAFLSAITFLGGCQFFALLLYVFGIVFFNFQEFKIKVFLYQVF